MNQLLWQELFCLLGYNSEAKQVNIPEPHGDYILMGDADNKQIIK